MRIVINHFAKMEGHSGFVADIVNGQIHKAKIATKEGQRLFESIVLGRNFREIPVITSRICGICPVIHSTTAIKALEKALQIIPAYETEILRKLLLAAQVVHSHALHLFFLSFPDFLGIEDDRLLLPKYSKEAKIALDVRELGNQIIAEIGGRAIHPMADTVGGFRRLPKKSILEKLKQKADKLVKKTIIFAELFANLPYPQFKRETEYIALSSEQDYNLLTGDFLLSSKLGRLNLKDFITEITETSAFGERVKTVYHHKKTYMLGAIARVNLNSKFLHKKAKYLWDKFSQKSIVYNTFYNLYAQSIEIIHFIEECRNLLSEALNLDLKKSLVFPFKIKSGQAISAAEAPRGTLIHYYELNDKGLVVNCNIITPTAQFLNNLEKDLKAYLPNILDLPQKARQNKIRTLVRAYDPCISCATH